MILTADLEIDQQRSIAVVPHGEYSILVQKENQNSPIIGPIIGDKTSPFIVPIIGDQVCIPIIIKYALNDNWLENIDKRFPDISVRFFKIYYGKYIFSKISIKIF